MGRMKAIPRSGAASSEAEPFRPELVESDEPRYLRRQKPVEIRRKKFGSKNLSFYRRLSLWILIVAAAGVACYFVGDFALHSPRVILGKTDQIELVGNKIVGRESLVNVFYDDRGRSVLTVPLEERRKKIQ